MARRLVGTAGQVEQPQGGRSLVDTSQTGRTSEGGLMSKISNFLLGKEPVRTAQMIGGTLGLKTGAMDEARASQEKAQQMNRQLIQRAQQAQEPGRREQLLQASRNIGSNLGLQSEEQMAQSRQATGLAPGQEDQSLAGLAAKQGLKTGAGVGAFLMPASYAAGAGQTGRLIGSQALQKGFSLGPQGAGVLQSVGRGAIQAVPEGFLAGIASAEEGEEIKNALKTAAVSSLFGGATSGTISVISKAWNTLTDKIPTAARASNLDIDIDEAKKTLQGIENLDVESAPGRYKEMAEWAKDLSDKAEKEMSKLTPESFRAQNLFPDPYDAKTFTSNLRGIAKKEISDGYAERGRFLTKLANELDERIQVGPEGTAKALSGEIDTKDILKAKRYLGQISYGEGGSLTRQKKRMVDRLIGALRGNELWEGKGMKTSKDAETFNRLLGLQSMASVINGTSEDAAKKMSERLGSLGHMDIYGPAMSIMGLIMGGPQWAVPGIATTAYQQVVPTAGGQKALYSAGRKAEEVLTPERMQMLRNWLTKGVARGVAEQQ